MAYAQTVSPPGTLLDTVRPEKPTTPAPMTEKPIAPPAPPLAPNLDPSAPRVLISEFQITGNHVIPTEILRGLIADQVGKKYNLYELQKVTRVLSDYYHSKAILSRVPLYRHRNLSPAY